jgi:hypothetical protein
MFAAFVVFSSYADGNESPNVNPEPNGLAQIIQAVDAPADIDFAGEKLDMDNFDVMERLDRELLVNSYWQSNMVLNIKHAHRYFPTIERILAENGVPDDFKYLAVAESGLKNVTSPAGAKGLWQFMKATGRGYNLTVTSEIDERMHLEKSTQAACTYLKRLKGDLGSWSLAAAAYNMGEAKLKSTMQKQRADSYYELNLNQETMRYFFRLVAIKEIMKNPRKYGFYVDDHQKYQPLDDYHEIEVTGQLASWGDFAKKYGTTYRMLKVYNPWITDYRLVNREGKKYMVRIPKKN